MYWFLRFLCVGNVLWVLSSGVVHVSADTVCMRDRIVHTGSGLEKYESAYIHKKGRFAFHKTSLPQNCIWTIDVIACFYIFIT